MSHLDKAQAIDFINIGANGTSCPIGRDQLLARFHASEDGILLSGAAAFAAMWRVIPRMRPLGLAARNGLVLAVLETLYRVFLRARPWLQAAAFRLEGQASVLPRVANKGGAS